MESASKSMKDIIYENSDRIRSAIDNRDFNTGRWIDLERVLWKVVRLHAGLEPRKN